MKSKILAAILFSCVMLPVQVHAAWYWLTIPNEPNIGEFTELSAAEYAVGTIPKDQLQSLPDLFMETISSAENSIFCSSTNNRSSITIKLREFDATHEFYENICIKGQKGDCSVISAVTVSERADLLSNIKQQASNCLQREQDDIERTMQKEIQIERAIEVQTALENCNFDFFDNEMTTEERMNTWDEREACKAKSETTIQVRTVPVVTAPMPASTHLSTPVAVPQTQPQQITETLSPQTEPSAPTIIEQVEKSNEPEPVNIPTEPVPQSELTIPKETIFKRIVSFFSRLLPW